jgi:phage anti-repressor protein
MDEDKAQEALQFVKDAAAKSESATDLHNAFFGVGGKFGELFPTRAQRERFLETAEYQEICRIRESLRQREKAAT